ncbi:MAG: hypothetical protein HKN51_12575 [Saprospiraceae bacterium]|nr:hypothetical protein [Saprospiraceae bacterium]
MKLIDYSKKIFKSFFNKPAKPNKNAIWIFGMQKAGTSVIAGLLAMRTGKSVTIDTPLLWQPYLNQIQTGVLDFSSHIRENPEPFSKDIIKEPNASLIIDRIMSCFVLEKYVFIYRNPFDLIRSILDRLNLPGNELNISIDSVHENWEHIFGNGDNYIENLSNLWVRIYSQFDLINSRNCILVKYEDFNTDKLQVIDGLCEQLDLKPKYSITEKMNSQFQPKGNSSVNLKLFFGEENIETINRITNDVRSFYEN